jgi:hypothetical protein
MKWFPQRKSKAKRTVIGYVAQSEHPFEVKPKAKILWPPFFATSIFLPRFSLKLTNKGQVLESAHIEIFINAYDGPIGGASSVKDGWVEAGRYIQKQWQPGQHRRLRVRIIPSCLPRAGTYIVKFCITRFDPVPSPYKDFSDMLRRNPETSENRIKQLADEHAEELKQRGIDPYTAQPGMARGHTVLTSTLITYFRVEDTSAVLTLWGVVATLLVAIATLLVAAVALISK